MTDGERYVAHPVLTYASESCRMVSVNSVK